MSSIYLQRLQKQLARTGAGKPEAGGESSGLFMEALDKAITEKAGEIVKVAKEAQEKAEARADDLASQLATLQQEMKVMQKEHNEYMTAMRKEYKEEMDGVNAKGGETLQQMRGEIASLQSELSTERQARARAEASRDAMEKTNAKMEQLLKRPAQAPAPAAPIQAPRPAPIPLEVAVSRRDQNGRIVSMTIKPST